MNRLPARSILISCASLLIVALSACKGGITMPPLSSSSASTASDAKLPSETIYVANSDGSDILTFSSHQRKNAPPKTVETAGDALLHVSSIAIDSAGHLYVTGGRYGSGGYPVVSELPAANGAVTPIAQIQGSNTQFHYPGAVAVDSNGTIYVADWAAPDVKVFPAGANGNVAPQRVLGPLPYDPQSVTVDRKDNVYVTFGDNGIAEYGPASTGNTLIRYLFEKRHHHYHFYIGPIAVDAKGEIYVGNERAQNIDVYAANAKGKAAPIRTIGGKATDLGRPSGMAFDHAGNLYVLACKQCAKSVGSGYYSTFRLLIFAPNASGDAKPRDDITGSKTTFNFPNGIALKP